jgi:hypothetical protein
MRRAANPDGTRVSPRKRSEKAANSVRRLTPAAAMTSSRRTTRQRLCRMRSSNSPRSDPARRKRAPAAVKGGTWSTTIAMARYVEPQTT